jgi:O-antigen/teichoic acid export membrane protein
VADIKTSLGNIFRVVGILMTIGGGFGAYFGWFGGLFWAPSFSELKSRYDNLLIVSIVILVIGISILVVGMVLRNLARREG